LLEIRRNERCEAASSRDSELLTYLLIYLRTEGDLSGVSLTGL